MTGWAMRGDCGTLEWKYPSVSVYLRSEVSEHEQEAWIQEP